MTEQGDPLTPAVQVYAAESLREAFTALASQYEARSSQKLELTFGACGLLRERIEQGANP